MQKYRDNQLFKKSSALCLLILSFLGLVYLFLPQATHAMEPIYAVLKDTTKGEGLVTKNIWTTLLNIANTFVVVILIAVAFAQILRINVSTYGVKKILPALVFAIIAANFSFLFCRLMIDVCNAILSIFFEGVKSGSGATLDSAGGVDCFKKAFQATIAITKDTTPGDVSWFIIGQFFKIGAAVMVLILAFLFLARNWMLYFLVALAPFCMMAMVLPQTKSLFTQWWSNFVKWVFMPVVSVFWLWLGAQWFQASFSGGVWLINYIFGAICLYLAITTPAKMGGVVMGQWSGLGRKAWGMTGGKAVAWAGREAKERSVDAGLRAGAYLQRGNRVGRAIDDTLGRGIRNLKGGNIEARQSRLLRAEGSSLVRKKAEEDARANAAFRLAHDTRIPDDVRGRYRSIVRNWVPDNAKPLENDDLQQLLNDLATNPSDNTVVTSDHNETIGENVQFTDRQGVGMQLARLEAIRRKINRPNSLSAAEALLANAIVNNANVSYGNAARGGAVNGPLQALIGGARVGIRGLDSNGFGVGAVGEIVETAGAPVSANVDPARASQLFASVAGQGNVTEILEKNKESLEKLDPKAQEAVKKSLEEMCKERDKAITEMMAGSEEDIEDVIAGVKMITNNSKIGNLSSDKLATSLREAREALARGSIEDLKKLPSIISSDGIAVDPKSANFGNDYKDAVRKRIAHLEAGNKHLGSLEGFALMDAQAQLTQDPNKYVEGLRQKLMTQNKINATATVTGQMAGQSITTQAVASNPNATLGTVASDMAKPGSETLERLAGSVDDLTKHIHNMSPGSINSEAINNKAIAMEAAKTAATGALQGAFTNGATASSPLSDRQTRRLFAEELGKATAKSMSKAFSQAPLRVQVTNHPPAAPTTQAPPPQTPPAPPAPEAPAPEAPKKAK